MQIRMQDVHTSTRCPQLRVYEMSVFFVSFSSCIRVSRSDIVANEYVLNKFVSTRNAFECRSLSGSESYAIGL